MATSIVKEATAKCSPCTRNKEEAHAAFWCNNCNEGLCQECSNHHTRNKASSHHKVLPLSDIQSELLLLDKLDINTQCEAHPDHQKTVFCEDDDVFCCTVCSSTNHRRCNNVQSIDSAVKAYTSTIRETDIQNINTLVVSVERKIEMTKAAINEAKMKSTEYQRDVQSRFDMAIKELQKIKNNVEENIQQAEQNVTQFHNKCLAAYESLDKELKEHLQVLHAHQKLCPAQIMMARHKTLKAINRQTETTLKTVSSDIPEMKISFRYISNLKYISLGSIRIEKRKSDESVFSTECITIIDRLCRHLSNKGTAQVARELVPLVSCDISFVALAERCKIQAGEYVPDGTYLPDNTILLCDSNNKQLIKLDENLGFLEKLPVAGEPYGVCVSSDGNRVHVVCDMTKVVSYTLQGTWREVQRFDVECGAWGIACNSDRIVTGLRLRSRGHVFIYDSTGTVVSRIFTNLISFFFLMVMSDIQKDKIIVSYYPTLSYDGGMLYHRGTNFGVVCRSMEDVTQELWRCSPKKLSEPGGMDTDRDGNILIVGCDSNNIHQISGDGNFNRILVNKLKFIKNPLGLFTNKNNNTFCVTSGNRFGEVCVEMYRFEDSCKVESSCNLS